MKRFIFVGTLSLAAATLGVTSCDWSGGSDGAFNSSRGGMDINISGNYRGVLSGGRAVAKTSGAPITSFVLQQSGNVLEVTDSAGQGYKGNVGSPLAIAELPAASASDAAPVLPAGAQLANFSVSWSGSDHTAGKPIRFTGVINVVSVNDVRGTATTETKGHNNSTTVDQNDRNTVINGQTGNQNTTSGDGQSWQQIVNEGVEGGFTTNRVVSTQQNANTKTNVTSNVVNNQTTSVGQTQTTNTFQLTDANTQFRLRGTWIENGGVVSSVDALSAGAGGVLVLLNFGVGQQQ